MFKRAKRDILKSDFLGVGESVIIKKGEIVEFVPTKDEDFIDVIVLGLTKRPLWLKIQKCFFEDISTWKAVFLMWWQK